MSTGARIYVAACAAIAIFFTVVAGLALNDGAVWPASTAFIAALILIGYATVTVWGQRRV